MKLIELAERLGCRLVEAVPGDGQMEIHAVAGMEQARPGEITFLANPKYAGKVRHTKASAIIAAEAAGPMPVAKLVSLNPYLDFARALECFYQPPRPEPSIHPSATLAPSAFLARMPRLGRRGDRRKRADRAERHTARPRRHL